MIVPIYAEQDSEKKESIQQFLDRAAEQIRPNGRTFAETLVWLKETYGAEEFEPSVAERDKVRANILLNRPDLSQGMPTDYCQLLNWLADKPEVAGLDVRGYRLTDGITLLLEMTTEGGQSSCKGAGAVFDEMALFRGVTEEDIRKRTRRFLNYAFLLKKRGILE